MVTSRALNAALSRWFGSATPQKMVRVGLLFEVRVAETRPGEVIRVVGSAPELGVWDPAADEMAVSQLKTSSLTYPQWLLRSPIWLEVKEKKDCSSKTFATPAPEVIRMDDSASEGDDDMADAMSASPRTPSQLKNFGTPSTVSKKDFSLCDDGSSSPSSCRSTLASPCTTGSACHEAHTLVTSPRHQARTDFAPRPPVPRLTGKGEDLSVVVARRVDAPRSFPSSMQLEFKFVKDARVLGRGILWETHISNRVVDIPVEDGAVFLVSVRHWDIAEAPLKATRLTVQEVRTRLAGVDPEFTPRKPFALSAPFQQRPTASFILTPRPEEVCQFSIEEEFEALSHRQSQSARTGMKVLLAQLEELRTARQAVEDLRAENDQLKLQLSARFVEADAKTLPTALKNEAALGSRQDSTRQMLKMDMERLKKRGHTATSGR